MKYRRMGSTGLFLSEIALGSWMTYGESIDEEASKKCMITAVENGINFFDCADIYATGKAEEIIGSFLKDEVVSRKDLVISSKVYWEMSKNVNNRGLGRKHIKESIENSLTRFSLDYLDIYFCHSYDLRTNLLETVRTMDDLITQGKIHYWGTSIFTAAELERIICVAKEHNLALPSVEQPRYNMIDRYIENEVIDICKRYEMGIVVWSPLYYGILTGKYNKNIPSTSRGGQTEERAKRFQEILEKNNLRSKLVRLSTLASELKMYQSQLSLAWILRQPQITSAITGASTSSQIIENTQSVQFSLSQEDLEEIENILDNKPLIPFPYDHTPYD
ncbi:MAG: aldo/keto reductase [Candidatus Heimdallarchaeota archaeon]|nr:aldo/keto reductase [Candidatus Heimdallarchaeota archaeon]